MASSPYSAKPSLSEQRTPRTPGGGRRTPTSNNNTKIFSSYIQDLNVYKEMCAQYKAAKTVSESNQELQRVNKNDVSKKLFPEDSEEGMTDSGKVNIELRKTQLECEALKIKLESAQLELEDKSKQLTQVLGQFQEILSDNQSLIRHFEMLQEEIRVANNSRSAQKKTPEKNICSSCQNYAHLNSAYDELRYQLSATKDEVERERRDRQYWELKYSEIQMEYDNLVRVKNNQQIYAKQSTDIITKHNSQSNTHQQSSTNSLQKPPAFPSSKSLSQSYAASSGNNDINIESASNDRLNEKILENAYREQMLRELKNLSVQTISSGYNQQLSFGSKEWTKIKAQQANEKQQSQQSSSWEINPSGKTQRSQQTNRLDSIGSSQSSSNCRQDSVILQEQLRQESSHIQQSLINQPDRNNNSFQDHENNHRKSNTNVNINSNNLYNNTPQSNASYKYLPLDTSSETASPQKVFQNSRSQHLNQHARLHSQQMTPLTTDSLSNRSSQNRSKYPRALSACGKTLPGYTAEINLSSSNERIEVNEKKSYLADEFKCQTYENNVNNGASQVERRIHAKVDHRDADSAGTICRYNSSSRECSEMNEEQFHNQFFEQSTRSGKFQEKVPLCGSSSRSSQYYDE